MRARRRRRVGAGCNPVARAEWVRIQDSGPRSGARTRFVAQWRAHRRGSEPVGRWLDVTGEGGLHLPHALAVAPEDRGRLRSSWHVANKVRILLGSLATDAVLTRATDCRCVADDRPEDAIRWLVGRSSSSTRSTSSPWVGTQLARASVTTPPMLRIFRASGGEVQALGVPSGDAVHGGVAAVLNVHRSASERAERRERPLGTLGGLPDRAEFLETSVGRLGRPGGSRTT